MDVAGRTLFLKQNLPFRFSLWLTAFMGIRAMNISFDAESDSSEELKESLLSGIDAFVRAGRVITEEKANAVIEAVESVLLEEGTGRRRRGGGRGGRGRQRNKLARWKAADYDALRTLDWETLDAIWEGIKEGSISEDADLKGDQKRAIISAYNKVPGDKRAERSEKANVVGRLKHLVSAYELAEAQGWKAGS
ncbi:MAG: hypothetical protein ACFB9M_10755 [Myxococcota bacterium]